MFKHKNNQVEKGESLWLSFIKRLGYKAESLFYMEEADDVKILQEHYKNL